MSNYSVCCDKCFETIAHRNSSSVKLWMDLCARAVKYGDVMEIHGKTESPELRVLELLQFIRTTDKPDYLVVKINGHVKDDNGNDFFCLMGGSHE